MNRFTRVLLILLCFELGVLLVIAPWSAVWERNFFLERNPGMIPWLLNPFLRGAISGLGLLDMWIALAAIFHRAMRRERPSA